MGTKLYMKLHTLNYICANFMLLSNFARWFHLTAVLLGIFKVGTGEMELGRLDKTPPEMQLT